VAASVPGRLRVGLHTFGVGPDARSLWVQPPSGRRITLTLRTFLGSLRVSRSLSGGP